ncbi:NAD-dependent epimerase/dehydratase family protein [Lachnospiraceae bacterium 48-42]|jgi:Nucleoside-diphosphate-sugar epimerases
MKKKILILGGAGFLGSNLCCYLRNQGYGVCCFDVEYPAQRQKGIHYIKGDFFNDGELEDAVSDKDCIIHAISTVNPGNSNELYMRGYGKDLLQTIRLCEMLAEKKIKMIFISSGGTVYGNHVKQPIDENVLPSPINHYGNIKLSIENAMRTFNIQMNTKFLIARVSNPYGQGQDFHKGVGFVDAVLKNTLEGNPVEIWGDGENVRDYVYISDVCEMMGCMVEYQGEEDTFNICSGTGVSQNEVIRIIRRMGLNPDVIYMKKRSVDVRKIILSNKKISSIWKKGPINLEEGIGIYRRYLEERVYGDRRNDT